MLVNNPLAGYFLVGVALGSCTPLRFPERHLYNIFVKFKERVSGEFRKDGGPRDQRITPSWEIPWVLGKLSPINTVRVSLEGIKQFATNLTWMSQGVSKRLVNGLQPQYTPFISRLYPFINFLGHPSRNYILGPAETLKKPSEVRV